MREPAQLVRMQHPRQAGPVRQPLKQRPQTEFWSYPEKRIRISPHAIFLFLTLYSCNNSRTQDQHQNETPKALEDKGSAYEIISKRGYDDLLESLYKELADKTQELKELEKQIDKLADSKSDSTELFSKYDEKSQSYYRSANNHVEQIKDTVLKESMMQLIENSLAKYNSSVSKHHDILKSINTKELSLNDLHLILKITRTLPLIDKYQKENLPATKSLEGYSNQLDKTIKYADSLTKK